MSLLEKYKIIKKIGYGMIGTVYLISTNNNEKYALKVKINMIISICH